MPPISRYPREKREKRKFIRSKAYDPIPPTKKRRRFRNKKAKKYSKFVTSFKIEKTLAPRVYKHYKLNRRNKDFITYKYDWKPMISKFFKVFRKHLLENESGVFIKDFGYFFIMRHDRLTKRIKFQKIHAEGKKYNPVFAPIRKDILFDTWTMDYGFSNTITQNMYENIENGVRYKMAYSLLYSIYGNKQNQLYLVKKDDNT